MYVSVERLSNQMKMTVNETEKVWRTPRGECQAKPAISAKSTYARSQLFIRVIKAPFIIFLLCTSYFQDTKHWNLRSTLHAFSFGRGLTGTWMVYLLYNKLIYNFASSVSILETRNVSIQVWCCTREVSFWSDKHNPPKITINNIIFWSTKPPLWFISVRQWYHTDTDSPVIEVMMQTMNMKWVVTVIMDYGGESFLRVAILLIFKEGKFIQLPEKSCLGRLIIYSHTLLI